MIILSPHVGNFLNAGCNECDNFYLMKEIISYSLLKKECEKCKARLINVKFKHYN